MSESLSDLIEAITDLRYRREPGDRDTWEDARESVLDRADQDRTERRERGER